MEKFMQGVVLIGRMEGRKERGREGGSEKVRTERKKILAVLVILPAG